jgi:hypothetical protein
VCSGFIPYYAPHLHTKALHPFLKKAEKIEREVIKKRRKLNLRK